MCRYRQVLLATSHWVKFGTSSVVMIASASFFLNFVDRSEGLRAEEVANTQQADQMQASKDKMRKISLALLFYESAHKHFPAAVIVGPDGKTTHSWRVEMLPYLGREKDYANYRMNEPWDSANNLEVAKAAADPFIVPSDNSTDDCGYFLLTGPSTPFDGKKTTTIRAIRDGTSNTVGVVEAKRSIPWSKPEDISYDPKKQLPELGGFFEGGFHVGFLDGSVLFIPKDEIDDETLRAMFTHAGGERAKRQPSDSWPTLVK